MIRNQLGRFDVHRFLLQPVRELSVGPASLFIQHPFQVVQLLVVHQVFAADVIAHVLDSFHAFLCRGEQHIGQVVSGAEFTQIQPQLVIELVQLTQFDVAGIGFVNLFVGRSENFRNNYPAEGEDISLL